MQYISLQVTHSTGQGCIVSFAQDAGRVHMSVDLQSNFPCSRVHAVLNHTVCTLLQVNIQDSGRRLTTASQITHHSYLLEQAKLGSSRLAACNHAAPDAACLLQAHVQDEQGRRSSSQTCEVALLVERGRSVPTDPARPWPLQLSRLERFTLWNNWPRFLQL